IDPANLDEAQRRAIAAWPSRSEVERFGANCDAAVLDAIAYAELLSGSPMLERVQAVHTIIEHEQMHQETLLYIIHRLPRDRQSPGRHRSVADEHEPAAGGRVDIAAGRATLGADSERLAFGWDNEFGEATVDVPEFAIDVNNVSNGEYLAFVRAGGPLPPFWIERDGAFLLKAMFADLRLPKTWPVYATHDQAAAYARWRGGRLPTEAEYHRAAFGTPGGAERAYPWGDDAPRPEHGNFDFRRFDPESVGRSPAGASAWGVHDLVGNGWEWTATPFGPLPGFAPMASYPVYSADFFDGKHFVMKGASPVTDRNLIRRSFRNWFYGDYPYMYATFRCVYE
ncbi:MAG: SUMF1/EgtB/PvdO family nonheme iron enzyme, partial [Vulcanimicrobiaceae bacterium]